MRVVGSYRIQRFTFYDGYIGLPGDWQKDGNRNLFRHLLVSMEGRRGRLQTFFGSKLGAVLRGGN
jgi:hypothetical protein